jgi:hypothetical protein
MASSLDHIEKTLAEAYRSEIDQKENIWRSLPFFAATLALELGAIYQSLGHLPPIGTGLWRASIAFIVIAALATSVALGFLAASILVAKFSYIASGRDLLEYATDLDDDERRAIEKGTEDPPDALVVLKGTLARQYAVTTHQNQRVNQRRTFCRSIAALAILVGVLSIVALAAVAIAAYIPTT